METAWSLLPDRLHICVFCRILVCRPVMLRGWAPCMFPPIPDHCYASMRTIHKQNKSIMNEAFPLLSFPWLYCVASLWGHPGVRALTSNRCFIIHNKEVDLPLFTHWPCKQPQLLPYHSYFNPVSHCSSFSHHTSWFLYTLHPPSPHNYFISFLSCAEILAAKVVFRRQCSTGIWLSLLSRGWFRLRDLEILKEAETKPIFKSLRQDLEDDCYTGVGRYYILRVLSFC